MRLFLSDLHLEDPESPSFRTFEKLLAREAPRASGIYILGDLCEVWVGDDDDGPLASALEEVLKRTSRSCPVFLMRGNRDFLFQRAFADAAGCCLIDDPHLLADGTLLSHGDLLCVDDHAYQQTRAQLRAPDWQAQILSRSLAERRALAASLREQSRVANANKAANIMDVSRPEVCRLMRRFGAARLIHGHTHRPGVHREAAGSRFVLGAWERCGWLLRQRAERLDLECFALGDRCESGTRCPAR
jgi:UDP-2,3-diacylglucosamine hydrolase